MREQPSDGLNSVPDGIEVTRENLPQLWTVGGFIHIHDLLSSTPRSAFQEDLLRALLIYSRQRLTIDPVEKAIFTITSLETLLFAGQPRLYQETTKRRLSGFLAGTVEMKEHINACVKTAYVFRNTFLHHGHSIAEIQGIEEFLLVAWCFFTRVLARHRLWATSKAFCDFLEDSYRLRFEDSPTSNAKL